MPSQQITVTRPNHSAPARLSWAQLLKRVFEIDIEQCPQCSGTLKIIAVILDPTVIAKILAHLGLPIRTPPQSPGASRSNSRASVMGVAARQGRAGLYLRPRNPQVFLEARGPIALAQ